MRYATLAALIITAGLAAAQSRPQMTFQGYVTGSAVLYIQGDRVDVQGRDTGSVDRPQYRFSAPLPAASQQVQVDVERGRGTVAVLEHPAPENEYTAVVRVDPPGDRPELYSINFYWQSQSRPSQYGGGRDGRQTRNRTREFSSSGEMTWSGIVDQEALIVVNGRSAVARTVRGQRVHGERTSFSSAMPRDVVVQLADAQGRGQMELLEQPSAKNGYAAVVRVVDSENGPGHYAFRLAWDGGEDDSDLGGVLTPGGRADDYKTEVSGYGNIIRWSGRVDGRVRVNMRGARAWVDRVSGGPVFNDHVNFGAPLPVREVRDVDIRKLEGREDVKIVQRPDGQNGYTLIFEINDNDSGADDYVVEVSWR
jgi:hypothetical protein